MATLLVGAVAAVELVLLVIAGVALLGRSLSHEGATAAAPVQKQHHAAAPAKRKRPKPRPVRTRTLARGKTAVLVLNGNGLTGAAGSEAALVRGRGYPVSGVGNARRLDYGRSIVMYRPKYRAEAARLARDLGMRIVAPLDGLKPSDLGSAKLAVIVGRD
jgi:hypothetical protein